MSLTETFIFMYLKRWDFLSFENFESFENSQRTSPGYEKELYYEMYTKPQVKKNTILSKSACSSNMQHLQCEKHFHYFLELQLMKIVEMFVWCVWQKVCY